MLHCLFFISVSDKAAPHFRQRLAVQGPSVQALATPNLNPFVWQNAIFDWGVLGRPASASTPRLDRLVAFW